MPAPARSDEFRFKALTRRIFDRTFVVLTASDSLSHCRPGVLGENGADSGTTPERGHLCPDINRQLNQQGRSANRRRAPQTILCRRRPILGPHARIYPVCVSDEPAVESFFFTTYSNEIFQKELSTGSGIRPVTMMSTNELEQLLPYVSGNSLSWPELLDFRSSGPSVGVFSVHQAVYDLLRTKGLPTSRNQAVRKNFDEV